MSRKRLAAKTRGAPVNKRLRRLALGAMLFALSLPVAAQEPAKIWRIGVLVSSSASLNASRDDALRQGLREMGYVEGKNIIMEYRYAEGKLDRLSELAADLVRSRPDLILVGGTRVAVAAKQATSVIPIVVTGAGDLVAAERTEMHSSGISQGARAVRPLRDLEGGLLDRQLPRPQGQRREHRALL